MPRLSDMPLELLLDNLLPSMPISAVLRLGSTSKFFAAVSSDDTFWKRKLQTDYNFSGAGTARTSGWKFIYRGLFKPRVYVWGERSDGRLGLSRFPKSAFRGVPFPTQLQIPGGARIVSLIASGMSFHALDSEGRIYVWGKLDGTTPALNSDGYSEPGKSSATPLRLEMPAPTRSISCGRLHSSSLDSAHQIWTFLSWGRPFSLSSPLLSDSSSKITQIECGWGFSSALNQSGDVFVWWPFSGPMSQRIESSNAAMDEQGDKKAPASPDGVIPCVTWTLDMDPVRLPSIPPLPDLPITGIDGQKPLQLVQIAGLNESLIGLTNKGHVLKFSSLESEMTASRGTWEYLPNYSEASRVRTNQFFSQPGSQPLQTMKITHISANFLTFIAYSTGSSSVVLMGDADTNAGSESKIIPALQNRSIISVALGDYHNVALTSNGKVLTWGAYSAGALGLGDPTTLPPGTPGAFLTEERRLMAVEHGRGEPPAVEVPTEVRFDHGRKKAKDRFCFSASAAGWHTGALVIDLEPDSDSEDDEVANLEPEPDRRSHWTSPFPGGLGQSPPIIPYPGIFRVGHPGRGRGGFSG